MAITPAAYMKKDRTELQESFLAWCYVNLGVEPKTAKERAMFELGVRAAGTYSYWQAERREAKKAAK